jgi:NAD(P)-dependent dehydrogenase (short-subunit alcohol dehydrogenase family)
MDITRLIPGLGANSPDDSRAAAPAPGQTPAAAPADSNPTPSSPTRRQMLGGMGGLGAIAGLAALAAAPKAAAQVVGGAQAKPLAGKAAIVTGARNNLGRAFSVALAKLGADVVVHYHRTATVAEAEETARLVRAEGSRAVLVQGDLGEVANVRKMFDTCEQRFGRVDVVVNNAGLIIKKPMAQFTEEDFDRLSRINTKALFFGMAEASRRMKDGGRIINIGTSLTAGTAPQYAGYAGTKAPVEEFTRMLTREIGSRGISVNTIAPGPLDTSFFHGPETPESTAFASNLSVARRLGRVDDIVPLLDFLARPESQWINGQTLFINGGYLTR